MRSTIRRQSPLITTYIDDIRYPTIEERVSKGKEVANRIGNFVHYAGVSIFYYAMFYDQENLPNCMGGKYDCSKLLTDFPFPQYPLAIPHLKTYYLFQLGANIYKLGYQIFFLKDDPKFYEFALHHFLTTFLIGFSFLIHALKMGSFIMLFHDFSDTFFLFSRIYYELKGKSLWILIPINLCSLITWCYCRLYVLPICSLQTLYFGPHFHADWPFVNDYFSVLWLEISMLTILFLMNIIWTYLILNGLGSMYAKSLGKKNK